MRVGREAGVLDRGRRRPRWRGWRWSRRRRRCAARGCRCARRSTGRCVSTRCSRSALVSRCSGRAVPQPAMQARMLRRLAARRPAGPRGGARRGARACRRAGRGTGCRRESTCRGRRGRPTVWPTSTWSPASTSSSGRNTPTDGAMIMRSGTRSPSPWFKRASMGYATSTGESGDVVRGGDVADGDVGGAALGERRRASSRGRPRGRWSAPRPTSVSMVERQRTGTETWSGRRSRQPSASV